MMHLLKPELFPHKKYCPQSRLYFGYTIVKMDNLLPWKLKGEINDSLVGNGKAFLKAVQKLLPKLEKHCKAERE